MQLFQMPNNRESQAESSMLSGGAGIRLAKTIKHVRQKLRANPLTSIPHHDLNLVTCRLQLHCYLASRRTEFDGVRKKVPNHLLQSVSIARNKRLMFNARHLKAHVPGVGSRPHGINSRLDYTGKVQRPHGELEFSRDDARDIQHTLN